MVFFVHGISSKSMQPARLPGQAVADMKMWGGLAIRLTYTSQKFHHFDCAQCKPLG
jgi:hypothetical protein